MPSEFGHWQRAYARFRHWKTGGFFDRVAETASGKLNLSRVQVDGTFVKLHQDATGARRDGRTPAESAEMQAIGITKGGRNTNIVALVDDNGNLVRFHLIPGNRKEHRELLELLEGIVTGELLADAAYDVDLIRQKLAAMNIKVTIKLHKNRTQVFAFDELSYQMRHKVENFFQRLKRFRGINTRYAKLADSFAAFVNLAGWLLLTK